MPVHSVGEEFYIGVYRVWLGSDHIVRHTALPDFDYNTAVTDGKAMIDTTTKLSGGERIPVLVDLRQTKGFSSNRETRMYVAGEHGRKAFIAVAYLVGSPVGTMMGNFFMKIHKPSYPVQVFTSEDEAIAWLKTFID